VKIKFTKHALEKLQTKDAKALKITATTIKKVINKPITTDKSIYPHRKTGKLSDELSLCVIYKPENDIIKVITFYPAEKGRYEAKI